MNRRLVKLIPNSLTFLNLICGFSAILILYKFNNYMAVPIAVILAMVSVITDFFDGFAARKLKTNSSIGEFLDSYADIVAFGIAPAFLINSMNINTELWSVLSIGIATAIYVVCGVYRLARYNANHSDNHFVGLPITAAGFITSVYCLIWYLCLDGKTASIYFIVPTITLCIILAVAMASHIKVKRLFESKITKETKTSINSTPPPKKTTN